MHRRSSFRIDVCDHKKLQRIYILSLNNPFVSKVQFFLALLVILLYLLLFPFFSQAVGVPIKESNRFIPKLMQGEIQPQNAETLFG
ncbi:unnamed protein product [Brugia timori]|uniref:Uncharacterized protein n=1 Tax=Brugia timori TaxID=42155 RepID=A0A0R3R3C5_9BILA|nr:unnamed protein product [Brugia timori]